MKLNRISQNKAVLEIGEARILFSHEIPVAAYLPGRPDLATGYIASNAKVSITTERHIREFIRDYEGAQIVDLVPQEELDALVQIPEGMAQ